MVKTTGTPYNLHESKFLPSATIKYSLDGGGNVGLIAGYHALQAGIQVVGLCEALPECGGYKVHADKIKRLGVPIYTIALGTPEGRIQVIDEFGMPQTLDVPPDTETLDKIADVTGAQAFDAPSAGDLKAVYDNLESRIGYTEQVQEVTFVLVAAGLILVVLGAGAAALWFGRRAPRLVRGVVVAAGNSNTDASTASPANCAGVITVGAVGRGGARAYYSNYGPLVDVSAPGGDQSLAGSLMMLEGSVVTIVALSTLLAWAAQAQVSQDWTRTVPGTYGDMIALDQADNAYVAGLTSSANFPLASPLQSSFRGGKRLAVADLLHGFAVVPGQRFD